MSDYQHWYYINKNYEEDGPVSSDELNEMVITGDIHRGTYVWTQELEEWVPASKVGGLFPDDMSDLSQETSGFVAPQSLPQAAPAQPSKPKLALKELVPVSKTTPKKSSQPSKATPISQATPIAPASPVAPSTLAAHSPTGAIGKPVIPQSSPVHVQQPTSPALTAPYTGGVPIPVPHHGAPAPATAPQQLVPTPLSSPQSLAARPLSGMPQHTTPAPPLGSPQPIQQSPVAQHASAPIQAAGATSIPIPGTTTAVHGLPTIPAIGSNPVQTVAPNSPALAPPIAKPPKPMSKPTPMRPS